MKWRSRQRRWFADGAVGIALLAGAGIARAQSSPVPALPDSAIRVALAKAWQVPPESIRLQWSAVDCSCRTPGTLFSLSPVTRDGWFALTFRAPGAAAAAVRARAGVRQAMAVASRPLLVGERLDQKMIGHAEITVWGPPGPEANSPTPGWIVRRALAPGDRLTPPAVEPAPVLRAGQRVRVVWIIGGVRVAAEGIAQNGAASGGRVRLRLSDRRGHAEGIARSSDSVFIIP